MPAIADVPPELFEKIVGYLKLTEKLRLSATNSEFRRLLAPQVFRSISFTNDERVSSSAVAAVQKYGQCTTHLRFVGHASVEDEYVDDADESDDDDLASIDLILPQAATKLLSGNHMPNLHTVEVKFDFDLESGCWDDNSEGMEGYSIYLFDPIESREHTRSEDGIQPWRALMTQTWAALGTNQTAKELVVRQFVPKWTTAFGTAEFQGFLGRLESTTISILGLDNGAGWKTNTMEGYIHFLSNLGNVFFNHMHALKQLYLEAADEGPLGLKGFRHIPLPLSESEMPLLESLKLYNCFVGPELVSFIADHAQVLKTLELNECVSAGDGYGMADNAIFWADFFMSVCETNPAISKLIVEAHVPFRKHGELGHDDSDTEPDDVFDGDEKRKPFGYAYLDEKYGMFFMDKDENASALSRSDDQRAYIELMKIVKRNATRQVRGER